MLRSTDLKLRHTISIKDETAWQIEKKKKKKSLPSLDFSSGLALIRREWLRFKGQILRGGSSEYNLISYLAEPES